MASKHITRRDFLNGLALGVAGAAFPGIVRAGVNRDVSSESLLTAEYYPPSLTGIRGNHKGAFEVAHALAWRGDKPPVEETYALDEEYDLVVVGAGLSGLAAAYFYRQQMGAGSKILILDNHDDFGGHAKRNEFTSSDGRTILGSGGSMVLADSDSYSDETKQLLEDIGVDLIALDQAMDKSYPFANFREKMGIYFDSSEYGEDKIVNGKWTEEWHRGGQEINDLLRQAPLSVVELEALEPFLAGDNDYLEDLSIWEKKDYLSRTSYHDFLVKRVGLSERLVEVFSILAKANYGHDASCLPALEGVVYGPGLKSVGWLGKLASKLVPYVMGNMKIIAFPDGNAGLARSLVHRLVPAVAPHARTPIDLVSTRFDYSQLESDEANVKIRLNSSVFNVSNETDESVSVSYVQDGKAYQLKAGRVILACYNGIIPHLCPEMPDEQKANLKYGVKTPLVYTNVLINNAQAFRDAGAQLYMCPSSPYSIVTKEFPVAVDGYTPSSKAEDSLVLHMQQLPSPSRSEGQTARDIYRIGRHMLYGKTFDQYETEIKEQLDGMFGKYGFNAERDIQAITVNRWSHGYAYEYNSLFDPDFESGQEPHVLGRKPFGRITIANSDSEAKPFLDGAIDAAWRAVQEQLNRGV